jgi:Leucine-rich repeat (LRR) protein
MQEVSEIRDSAFSVATAAATVCGRLWLQATAPACPTTVDQLIAGAIVAPADRRRARRTLDFVADEIAEMLGPGLEAAISGRGAVAATSALGVATHVLSIADLTAIDVGDGDIDPFTLESALNQAIPNTTDPEAQLVLRALISELADYLVVLVPCLPSTWSSGFLATLRQEGPLLAAIHEKLANLPRRTSAAGLGVGDFETRYRREMVRTLDQLDLFGLSVQGHNRRYPLSVAYISLSARTAETRAQEAHLEKHEDNPASPDSADADESEEDYRVEDALALSDRLLLRGEAGSGKTTLLQYLAVRSGARTFLPPLAEWNDTIPFFVQLRRYAGADLPEPSAFLELLHPNLHEAMPEGWVIRQLASGRGLVLIDGVDELVGKQRDDARSWLAGLCADFPSARYIVTSRPPAISVGWLLEDEFRPAELLPMGLSDIDSFIDHWHSAAAQEIQDDAKILELERLRRKLQASVRVSRPIRGLSTSPLLCAMLCALNRDRRSHLPDDRSELYRIALETLLDRRDVEREVAPSTVKLSYPDKLTLLRHLAYWLMRHDRSDMPRAQAVSLVGEKLAYMPGVASNPQKVFSYLLERSGLLREPIDGRIDFVHRTFQEYLAAHEVVRREEIQLLIEHMDRDEWREVIILAAAHANPRGQDELITALLDEGDRRPARSRAGPHLLAVACLESSTELSAGVTERLQRALDALMPPTNMTEARAVAAAGEIAIPLLARFADGDPRGSTAAACVRALSYIGDEQAMAAIAAFAPNWRVAVAREIVRAWSRFDPDPYAQQVLSRAPFPRGLRIDDSRLLPTIRHLEHLDDLTVVGRGNPRTDIGDLSPIANLRALVTLRLHWIANIRHLAPLASLRNLRTLELVRLPGVERLDALTELRDLTELQIRWLPVADLSPLAGLGQLRRLSITHSPNVVDVAPAIGSSVEWLHLADLQAVKSLRGIDSATALRTLSIADCPIAELEELSELGALEELELHAVPGLETLALLAPLKHVRTVRLTGAEELTDLEALDALESLEELHLSGCPRLIEFGPVRRAGALTSLSLVHTRISDLDIVGDLPALRDLNLARSSDIVELAPLDGLEHLTWLRLLGCHKVVDLTPLAACSQLEYVDLEGCTSVESLDPLLALPALRHLDIRQTKLGGQAAPFRAAGVSVLGAPSFVPYRPRALRPSGP